MTTITRLASVGGAGLALAIAAGCFQPSSEPSVDPRLETGAPMGDPIVLGALQALDLEDLPAGTILGEVYGTLGDGPILVNGISPLLDGNTALVFDSANPTGGDDDLGTPNETCGGPGEGAGGEVGSPYENCDPLGKVLIIAADLEDADSDGLVDDPDDIDVAALDGVILELDFSALGSVTMSEMVVLDIDGNSPDPRVEMYDGEGGLLATVPIPNDMENNGVATVDLGGVSGVVEVIVHLQGSGAIDTFFFTREVVPPGEIGDLVWCDDNGNGVQDDGEPGIPDVTVNLECVDDEGAVIATASTTTDENGAYLFSDVPPGLCTVTVEMPDDVEPGVCDTSIDVDLAPGQSYLDADFCFVCAEPPTGGEGCTPGYWKQEHHFCHWPAPYAPDGSFADVFDRDVPGVETLHDGVTSNGSYQNLVFHAVAALLNAASDEVEYAYSVEEVIDLFQDGWDSGDYGDAKDQLEAANEEGCPLGNCRD